MAKRCVQQGQKLVFNDLGPDVRMDVQHSMRSPKKTQLKAGKNLRGHTTVGQGGHKLREGVLGVRGLCRSLLLALLAAAALARFRFRLALLRPSPAASAP